MKFRKLALAALLVALAAPLALAQPDTDVSVGPYVPRLADIMTTMQLRHLKLYFAARAHNWQLADFELRLLRSGLAQAAVLYGALPVSNITTLAEPAQSLYDALQAKDERKFMNAFGQLTSGCNSCHQTMDRKFIVIGQPAGPSPFTNQVFAPDGKK